MNAVQHRQQPEARVARTLEEVLAAWGLVYAAYLTKGLIDPNVFGLHTNFRAARPGAVIVCGDTRGELTSTLTITRDGSLALPLDEVFAMELEALRSGGDRLCELGLFTHRSSALPMNMLAASIALALHGSNRIVIGVHPRHVGFYGRMFGFSRSSDERRYATLREAPVCLMHLDRLSFTRAKGCWGERSGASSEPLNAARAYPFASGTFSGTPLAHYLESRVASTALGLLNHTTSSADQPREQALP